MKFKSFRNYLRQHSLKSSSTRSSLTKSLNNTSLMSYDSISLAGNLFRNELNESRRTSRSNSRSNSSILSSSTTTRIDSLLDSPTSIKSTPSSSFKHYGLNSFNSYDDSQDLHSNASSTSSTSSSASSTNIMINSTEELNYPYKTTTIHQMSSSSPIIHSFHHHSYNHQQKPLPA